MTTPKKKETSNGAKVGEFLQKLKKKYFPDIDNWVVEQGSVMDEEYLKRLPSFDVVYSSGVLHHTGEMWQAMDILAKKVGEGGDNVLAPQGHFRRAG